MAPAADDRVSFHITAEGDENARIARAFATDEWQGDAGEAGALLEALVRRWPEGREVDFLALWGGFLRFRWPDRLGRRAIGDNLNPSRDTVNRLYKEAENCFRPVFDGRMRALLRRHARCVTFGVDSHFFASSWQDPHAELVFALDLETGEAWATGKSYPNPRQQYGLVRVPDLESHFIRACGREVMLLSCHDLNLFSPRSLHNARGWRRDSILRFRELTAERAPELLIWHPHKSDTPRTWIPGLGGLRKERPGIAYAGAGVYYNGAAPPRSSLDSVRRHTAAAPMLDFVAERKQKGRKDVFR